MKHALRSETFVPQTDPMLVRELALQHKVLPLVCEAIPTVPPVMKKQARLQLVHQTRLRDQELERLILRNEETQKLLDRTRELAHHQRLQTIGSLTAGVAHEFNNLLAPIMGYSMMALEQLPEDQLTPPCP